MIYFTETLKEIYIFTTEAERDYHITTLDKSETVLECGELLLCTQEYII